MHDNIIIIATTQVERGLYTIAKEGMICDEMEIQFTERYAPTVEYLLRMLRKGFGWLERDRGEKTITNKKCTHNNNGKCALNNKQNKAEEELKCSTEKQNTCKDYTCRYGQPLHIQYVIIYKAGGIRGL